MNPSRDFDSMRSAVSDDGKYLGSGCSSKMSNNEHSFSALGNSEMLAVAHLPLHVVPQFVQRREDGSEGSPVVVTEESFDVLKEKKPRSFGGCDPAKIEEQSPASVFKSSSFSCNGEGLAGETAAEEVEVGKRVCCDTGDVSIIVVRREARGINLNGILIDLREADALMPSLQKRNLESSDAAEGGEEAYARIVYQFCTASSKEACFTA